MANLPQTEAIRGLGREAAGNLFGLYVTELSQYGYCTIDQRDYLKILAMNVFS